jgi:tRNA 5-methylaminomethyl-2-thiouridine biosynthesis bifunctional protein
MKTTPVRPATLAFTAEGVPYSPAFDDVYHSRSGALAQANHVFIAGNGLPQRWAGRERFVVLETGFGLGNNFLATWDAWRRDPKRCTRLHFISIDKHPLTREALASVHAESTLRELADELIAAWPVLTPNLHCLSFEGSRVQLQLALGDVAQWLREIVASVDAFYLDGFAPAKNPQMWERAVLRGLGRLAAPHATAATWSVARELREGLAAAGFRVETLPGFGGKREMTVASFELRFTPRRAPARAMSVSDNDRHAVIVGAGLAGCASAWALARQGWTSLLIDRQPAAAMETSGNRAGLFHGIVNAQDGAHARFNRAAALEAERVLRPLVAAGAVDGRIDGVLRLETQSANPAPMQAVLRLLELPADYVQALDVCQVRELSGLPLQHPAWFFPGGGCVAPASVANAWLADAAGQVVFRGGVEVGALQRSGSMWRLLDARSEPIAEAAVVVLANAADALRLLGHPPWPLQRVRGQTTTLPVALAAGVGLSAPRLPLAGAGYLLPAFDNELICGATTQPGDDGAELRDADHRSNLAQLSSLVGMPIALPVGALNGRVGWRVVAGDRLPVIGALPDAAAISRTGLRLDQPRFVPRAQGLYVHTALASRGIGWAPLTAQVLASLITGAPCPVESSLLDAVDVARFASRAARRPRRHQNVNVCTPFAVPSRHTLALLRAKMPTVTTPGH